MNDANRLKTLLALTALLLGGCGAGHTDDDGHDHAAHALDAADVHVADAAGAVRDDGDEADDPDRADDPDHAELADEASHAGEADVHEEDRVDLTPDQREQLGLRIATAGPGTIDITATFPGEVILDPNRMAHIVPRAAGIVREVGVSLGDHVEAGAILAWIESDELAEAKLDYYAKHAELGCCQAALPRAKEIFESTHEMLALLEGEPDAEALQRLDAREMGEHRGRLVTAYAAYLVAKKALDRERELFGKSVSSESEFIAAEAAFKTAQAHFTAAKDVARYQVMVDYSEAARERQVAEFEAVAAAQRLRLKGVGDDVLDRLLALVPRTGSLEPCLCGDPNCKEHEVASVLDALGEEARLGWYAIRAPFAGYVTDMHMTLGEKVDGEAAVMTIADTSRVWVRFSVYQKDLSLVRAGQEARVDLGAGMRGSAGTITSVAPLLDRETRTAPARIELENPDGTIRPGLYATVHVTVEPLEAGVVVRKSAVQVLEGDDEVIFVPDGDGFIPVPVRLGRADLEHVAVLAGLAPGRRYVEQGAFELKASIVTRGAGAHAGHGH